MIVERPIRTWLGNRRTRSDTLERVKEYSWAIAIPLEIILFEQKTSTSDLAAKALGVELGE